MRERNCTSICDLCGGFLAYYFIQFHLSHNFWFIDSSLCYSPTCVRACVYAFVGLCLLQFSWFICFWHVASLSFMRSTIACAQCIHHFIRECFEWQKKSKVLSKMKTVWSSFAAHWSISTLIYRCGNCRLSHEVSHVLVVVLLSLFIFICDYSFSLFFSLFV